MIKARNLCKLLSARTMNPVRASCATSNCFMFPWESVCPGHMGGGNHYAVGNHLYRKILRCWDSQVPATWYATSKKNMTKSEGAHMFPEKTANGGAAAPEQMHAARKRPWQQRPNEV